jgi:hypothetical protein
VEDFSPPFIRDARGVLGAFPQTCCEEGGACVRITMKFFAWRLVEGGCVCIGSTATKRSHLYIDDAEFARRR